MGDSGGVRRATEGRSGYLTLVSSRPHRRRHRHVFRRLLAVVIAGAVSLAATACDGDTGSTTSEPGSPVVGVDAYVTVIARFLPPSLDPESLPVVYVVPASGDALPIEIQVGVIEALAQGYDIRFVDVVDAALDAASTEESPRDEGTLIGLGRIKPDPPHQVRVELYRGRDRVSGHLVTLRNDGGVWVIGDSETVTPEVLVGDG